MFANLLAGLASGGTIAIGAVRILALRNQHRQLNAKTYIESSGRFQELLRSFPTELGLLTPILLILRGNLWQAQRKLRPLAFKYTKPEMNTARLLVARGRIARVKQPGDSDRRRGSSGPPAFSWS